MSMFRHSSSPSSAPSYTDALMNHRHAASFSAAALSVTVPAHIPRGAAAPGYLDAGNVHAAFSSPPSSCYSSSSLPASSYYSSIQRSISSHSLPVHIQLADVSFAGGASNGGFLSPSSPSPHQLTLPPLSSSPSSSSGDLFEFTSSCPVRRVFSTGDLQVYIFCSSRKATRTFVGTPHTQHNCVEIFVIHGNQKLNSAV